MEVNEVCVRLEKLHQIESLLELSGSWLKKTTGKGKLLENEKDASKKYI